MRLVVRMAAMIIAIVIGLAFITFIFGTLVIPEGTIEVGPYWPYIKWGLVICMVTEAILLRIILGKEFMKAIF
jgi:hypothetical protein